MEALDHVSIRLMFTQGLVILFHKVSLDVV